MTINTNKTKELIICFNKKVNAEDIPPLCINENSIERVDTFKYLVYLLALIYHGTITLYVSIKENHKANVVY